jgi:hypothetical protein
VPRRRIWSEDVAYDVVRSPRVLGLLAPRRLELCLAVRPGQEPGLPRVLGACAEAGVPVALWPMLADRDGRWVSAKNAGAFAAWARRIVDELARDAVPCAEIVVDLEPAIDGVRAALDRPLEAPRRIAEGRAPIAPAARALDDLAGALRDRGVAISAAIVPLVAVGARGAWEAALGTPVSGVAWDHVSAMVYSSIVEGWSRGLLARADAIALVASLARAAVAAFGARAGVSLGAVGVGAFGDEPVLRSPRELADDVAAVASAGVSAITLLDLGGVLARPPAEAWLDALVVNAPAPRTPPISPRAAIALAAARSLAPLARRLVGA